MAVVGFCFPSRNLHFYTVMAFRVGGGGGEERREWKEPISRYLQVPEITFPYIVVLSLVPHHKNCSRALPSKKSPQAANPTYGNRRLIPQILWIFALAPPGRLAPPAE